MILRKLGSMCPVGYPYGIRSDGQSYKMWPGHQSIAATSRHSRAPGAPTSIFIRAISIEKYDLLRCCTLHILYRTAPYVSTRIERWLQRRRS